MTSRRPQDVLPRECCLWPSYLQTSMDSCSTCRKKTTYEDDANDPRAVALRMYDVGHVPKACSLASSIDKDS